MSYAQALRLRRICSRLDWFNHRVADPCRFLVARGYKKAIVLKQIRRVRLKTREGKLPPRPRNATNRVPVVVTYHPSLPNIGSILRELQPLLHCLEKMQESHQRRTLHGISKTQQPGGRTWYVR